MNQKDVEEFSVFAAIQMFVEIDEDENKQSVTLKRQFLLPNGKPALLLNRLDITFGFT